MEARKIQMTGGSTYTVSLPKNWVKEKAKPGDNVYLQQNGENINISFSDESGKVETAMVKAGESNEISKRRIAGVYLNGVDKIIITNIESGRTQLEDFIRNNLVGMEITKIEERKIETRNLFESSRLSAKNGLRRMDSTITTMMNDLVDSPEKVSEMDDILDKYYLLLLRQLVISSKDSEMRKKMGLDQDLKAMDFRLVAKSLERIGDHIVSLSNEEENKRKEIEESKQIYEELSQALFKSDLGKAEEAIKKLEERGKEKDYHLERIKRLLLDIANTVINFSIRESDEVTLKRSEAL